jgi:hypothetical protein
MKLIVKILIIFALAFLFLYIVFFLLSLRRYDVEWGISFNQNHASYLGFDWKKVYSEMLSDLKPQHIRIAAMWSNIERDKGKYDFSEIDWMMDQAEKNGTKVLLVIGQKAPRWPECYVPSWLDLSQSDAKKHFFEYVFKTAERYKKHKALLMWQVENEPFINFKFGDCAKYDINYVEEEVSVVQKIDSDHKIVITDSGELSTWFDATRLGDIFGTTMYRIVRTPGGYIFNYDWVPAGFYWFKARILGKDFNSFMVAELQAEPWFFDPNPNNTTISEQEKTMNLERLKKHIDYSQRVGASKVYLWGVEWWYWMKERGNSAYWEEIKSLLNKK